jgi:tRNA-modifying protein YgfZ
MGASRLGDRGIVRLIGGEAEGFLHRIVTNSTLGIAPGEARYAALLSPQGKLLFDFLVVPLPEGAEAGFYLDCAKAQAQDLVKRLNFHKLRAKITIEDRSATLGVAALWDEGVPPGFAATIYGDPRAANLGLRVIAPHELLAKIAGADEDAYEAHRIALGIAKGGIDFPYGDTFLHDANLDLMHGVDFKKGCYVGQEVVARVQYRQSARKRIVNIHFDGPAAPPGTPIVAGETALGQVGSAAGAEGLAMLRIDRLEEAKRAGVAIMAGGTKINVPAEISEAAALDKH